MTPYHTVALIVAIILAVLIVTIKNLCKKRRYENYNHHGCCVWVRTALKGKHRTQCLCWECKKLRPGREDNCPIAAKIYYNCVQFNVVTPVYECPAFDSKFWK